MKPDEKSSELELTTEQVGYRVKVYADNKVHYLGYLAIKPDLAPALVARIEGKSPTEFLIGQMRQLEDDHDELKAENERLREDSGSEIIEDLCHEVAELQAENKRLREENTALFRQVKADEAELDALAPTEPDEEKS